MRKFVLLAAVLALLAILAVLAKDSLPQQRHRAEENAVTRLAEETKVSNSDSEQEVEALRMQLKHKDAVLASVIAMKLQKAGGGLPDTRAAPNDPRFEVMRVLDERLEESSQHPSETGQMASEIRAAIDRGVLASARMTELTCAGRLCRLAISDDSQEQLEKSAIRVSQSLGKTVGGITVVDGEEREKIVYLARSSDDLAVAPSVGAGDTAKPNVGLGPGSTSPSASESEQKTR